ncbi:MAG: ATP-binding cassette domain-containing protein [Acidobacteria bacterium]|nr:ATP-binding cassette domain-containing protein [Acidobacteriota bacterium]
MYAIELKEVTKQFGDFLAVRNLSFKVPQGSIYGFLGPNGAGKTTTIRMIINIVAPDSGEILLLGQKITSEFQKQIGYLPEDRGLYSKRRIRDQLIFFGRLKGLTKREAGRQVDHWLARFELSECRKMTAVELSKGMRQKVQFIAAVIHDPELLILDEPFTGLDPISVSLLKEVILGLKLRGRTIIFSTHQMEQVEQICDEVCLINHGTKVLDGTLAEIKQRFKNNLALLGFSGNDSFLANELFGQVNKHRDHIEVVLKDPTDGQELLRQALSAGAVINRFQMVEPSLNDIFIKTVGAKNGED